jgi:hypothetical protein
MRTREYYKEQLERYGYTVVCPSDTDIAWLPSGLLTAFLESEFTLVSSCFCTYTSYHNVECFANKGFHAVTLKNRNDSPLMIINTHTQSTTFISWFFGDDIINTIRKQQFQQILRYVRGSFYPVLVIGDLNCEFSPHPYIRFLMNPNCTETKKHTFESTGEDLDHIGWIPLQYANPGCGYCDIEQHGPSMESCEIIPLPWSDHSPVFATVRIPKPKQRVSE